MQKRSVPDDPEPRPASSGPISSALRPAAGSVHASVADEIGQRIVRGDYPPGTILPNEAKWAETFKVSRSVVREAVKMLTAKSLLASRPKVGSRVEPRERWNFLDRDVLTWYSAAPDRGAYIMSLQEFRNLVEPEAAAYAAMRRTTAEAAMITRHHQEMLSATDQKTWMEADIHFHRAILSATGNDLLLPLGVIVESALRHLFGFLEVSDISLSSVSVIHGAIERSIRLQRPDAARRAMRRLLAHTDETLRRKLAG